MTGLWFPLVWTLLIAAVLAVNYSIDLIPLFGEAGANVLGRMLLLVWLAGLLGWVTLSRRLSARMKFGVWGSVLALIGLGLAMIREIENTGNNEYRIHWRWEPTAVERIAAYERARLAQPAAAGAAEAAVALPRFTDFLGPLRDGHVPGPALASDWSTQPPRLLWRRPVGGGYAGFVVAEDLAITIEQRAQEETVVAYDAHHGHERWSYRYPAFFRETMGGDGPRATPTIAGDQVFALGATGELLALELRTGQLRWRTNILQDAQAANLIWGMCGAPLVVDQRVIVNPGGREGRGLIAYDRQTGQRLWSGGSSRAAMPRRAWSPCPGRPRSCSSTATVSPVTTRKTAENFGAFRSPRIKASTSPSRWFCPRAIRCSSPLAMTWAACCCRCRPRAANGPSRKSGATSDSAPR